ncbi:hypothetical protein F4782DRAFT_18063 [Xylaria castorea]|nr:hypothetical protein F4782DRAFT_18063 [Xylaria castorea]
MRAESKFRLFEIFIGHVFQLGRFFCFDIVVAGLIGFITLCKTTLIFFLGGFVIVIIGLACFTVFFGTILLISIGPIIYFIPCPAGPLSELKNDTPAFFNILLALPIAGSHPIQVLPFGPFERLPGGSCEEMKVAERAVGT